MPNFPFFADDMPKVVRGDSARIVQIFTNLISNSIKFTSGKYLSINHEHILLILTNYTRIFLEIEAPFISKRYMFFSSKQDSWRMGIME